MVVNTWSRYFVQLLSRLACKSAISFHAFLCMTLHIVGTWTNVCFSFFWIRQFFFSCSWHSGFKQIPVIFHNTFACFAFSLSATQINMVKAWCWFSQINVFHENLYLASAITSLLFLTFVSCHAGILSSFFLSLSTATFASSIFMASGIRKIDAQDDSDSMNSCLFLQCSCFETLPCLSS